MKKLLNYFFLSIIIAFISSSYSFSQMCNSNGQYIDYFNSICVNSTVTLNGGPNKFYQCDEYGWCDEWGWANPITVKRPDGSVALVINESDLTTFDYWSFTYVFPAGFFNVVGNWTFSCLSEDYCTGSSYTSDVYLKVVGTYSNSIGTDEVICNVGGTPQNIVNSSLTSNSAYTINWQSKIGAGSWNSISGATLASYQPGYINQTTSYRRFITTTELGCVSGPSNEVIKYVYSQLTTGAIGSNQDVCYNISPSLITETTAPTGGSSYPNYSYQWYSSIDNINWNPISGAISKTHQPSFTPGYTYFKRKTIDASCGETFTNTIQIHGYNDLTAGTIGSNQHICYNSTPSPLMVTSVETGGVGSNTYQWYSSTDNLNWSVASGSSTGQNYQPPALTAKTYYRKAIINSCRTVYTNPVTIDVRLDLSSGSIGGDQTICYNEVPGIIGTLVNPSGASNSFTYAWESSLNNSTWDPIPGANLVSFQPTALTQTTYFRKKVIDANCLSVYTNKVTVTVRPAFSIGTIGNSQNICNGITPVILSNSTPPSGGQGTYSYIWESSLNNADWNIITGATGVSYQPVGLTVTTYYRRKVTDALCGNGYNNTVTITVKPVFSVGSIGSAQTICINTAPALLTSTSPSGGAGVYSYYWESSLNGTDFNNISGATDETYQPGVLSQTTHYRRHVTDASCGNGFTNTVKITVRSSSFFGTIGSDQTICYYQTPYILSFNVPASDGSGMYTYEWQSTENGTNWVTIPGATMNEYQPVTLALTTKYRILVTDAICGSGGFTNIVTVTVRPIFKAGNIGYPETICYGHSPSAIVSKIAPSGGSGSYTYEWSSGNNGIDWNLIPSATGETYQPGILTQTTLFRRKVTDVCGSGYSLNDTVTVRPPLVPGSISSNQSICHNTAPGRFTSLSLPSGATGVYTYQWQSSTNNVSWNSIAGATDEEYQPIPMVSSLYFRRLETSGSCGTGQTNSVFVTVNSQLVAGSIKSDETICYGYSPGTMITNTAPVGGTGAYTYQWQKLIGTDWTDIQGATTENFTPNALTSTSYFRRTETSGSCGTVISNQITKTVLQQFSGGIIGSSQTISYNTAPTLLTSLQSPSGGTLPYTFQWMKSEDNSYFVNVNGATSETYQPGNLSLNTYFKRVTSSSTCGSVETNTVTITVANQLLPGTVTADQTKCFKTAPSLITGSTPSGGTGLFSFQWMKSFNNADWFNIEGEVGSSIQPGILTENTYFRRGVTSGANSSFSNSVKVTVYQPLNIPTTDAKSFYCTGTSFQLSVLNPVYVSYKWYDSSQNYIQDGTKINVTNFSSDKKYFLKAVNSLGCFSDPVEIPLFVDNVQAGFTNDITTVTLGSSVKFTSTSVNASNVSWNFFEGDIIHETSPVHYYNTLKGSNSNKFDVMLTAVSSNGCKDSLLKKDLITVINDVTGIEKNMEITFSYYPNPVSEKLWLTSNERIKTVKIFNISGKMIKSLIFDSEAITIDFSSLKSDIYILEINGFRNSKKNIKIIKK